MTDIQEEKVSSYEATDNVLHNETNLPIWSGTVVFAALVTLFKTLIADIRSIRLVQERSQKGKAIDKAIVRADLTKILFKVINGVKAHAIATDDNDLKKAVSYTLSDLETARDNVIADRASLVHSIAFPLTAQLRDLKVVAADITLLDTLNKSFLETIAEPRAGTVTTKTATSELKLKFREIDTLLRDKMDEMVLIFEPENPTFVEQYQNSRIIVNTGHRKSGTKSAVVTGRTLHFETLEPLINVSVRIVETGTEVKSDAQGYFKHIIAKAGTYTFQAIADGYKIATEGPIDIQLGNSIGLDDFELEPNE